MKHVNNRHQSILIDKAKAAKKVKEQRRCSTKTFYFDDMDVDTKRVRVFDEWVGLKWYTKRAANKKVRRAEYADGNAYKKAYDMAYWVS